MSKIITRENSPKDFEMNASGRFTIQVIDPDGTIVHDTGECKNVVTHYGVEAMLLMLGGGTASVTGYSATPPSTKISHVGLGTGAIAVDYANSLNLVGELAVGTHPSYARQPFTSVVITPELTTFSNYTTLVMKASFLANFVASQVDITKVALFNGPTAGVSLIYAASSNFGTVTVQTTQQVDVTYTIRLNQALGT